MNKSEALIRLVDDDASLLFSTQIYLQTMGWKVVAYDSPGKFLRSDDLDVPGCLVLDFRMPNFTGLEVQQIMIERGYKHFPIIFLSGHGDIEMAVNAMSKGAVTFLEKPADPERLNAEVEKAVELGFSRSRRAKERLELKRRYSHLTAREKEVLHLVVDGLTNKEIGDKLGLSLATVKMHRGHAAEKLELSSVAEITRALILIQEEDHQDA